MSMPRRGNPPDNKGFMLLAMIFALGIFATTGGGVCAQDLPFKPGESITYDLIGQIKEWRMKGTLGRLDVVFHGQETFNGRPVCHASATASSSLLLRTRFALKDVFHSWFDPKTFQTLRVEKTMREGGYANHVIYEVDPRTGVVTEYNKNVQKVKKYPRPDNAYDFVSFFYWLRSARKDSRFSFALFDGDWKNRFSVSVAPGADEAVPLLDKKNKQKILVVKEDKAYGLTIKFAKGPTYLPIEMNVVNVQAGNVHITGKGVLTGYKPG